MVSINQIGSLALVLVIGAFVIAVGATMLDQLYGNLADTIGTGCVTASGANCSVAQNVTRNGLDGMGVFAQWLPLIALVIVLSIVIGVIVNFMGRSA